MNPGKLSLQGSTLCRWYANPEIPEAMILHSRFQTQPPYLHIEICYGVIRYNPILTNAMITLLCAINVTTATTLQDLFIIFTTIAYTNEHNHTHRFRVLCQQSNALALSVYGTSSCVGRTAPATWYGPTAVPTAPEHIRIWELAKFTNPHTIYVSQTRPR